MRAGEVACHNVPHIHAVRLAALIWCRMVHGAPNISDPRLMSGQPRMSAAMAQCGSGRGWLTCAASHYAVIPITCTPSS
jgi:hypothetical protein